MSHPFEQQAVRSKRKSIFIRLIVGLLVVSLFTFFFLRSDRGGILVRGTEGEITVRINGTTLSMDRNRRGYFIPLYAGQYRVVVEKQNHSPFSQDVLVQRGKTTEILPVFAFTPPSLQTAVSSVDFMHASSDGASIYYAGDAKTALYRMEVTTQQRISLSLQAIPDIHAVQWSSNQNLALVSRRDGLYLTEIPSFDFRSQRLIKIAGTEVQSAQWDPIHPNRIASILHTPAGEHSLVFSDSHMNDIQRKADVAHIPNPTLTWSPNGRYILILGQGSTPEMNHVWAYTTATGTLEQITTQAGVLGVSIAPDEKHIIFQRSPDILSLYSVEERRESAISQTAAIQTLAWKDNQTLLIPTNSQQLVEMNVKTSSTKTYSYSFPETLSISRLLYFSKSNSVIFSTSKELYTLSLGDGT
jgi:hypothetical protein